MNDGRVGDGSYGDDLLNQSSGDPPDAAGLAPVETKRVLIQVRSEVLTACASVIGPEQPPFEKIRNAVALMERILDLDV